MRNRDKPSNSAFLSNFLLLAGTVLSILTIVAPSIPLPQSLSLVAFASHGGDHRVDRSISEIARGSYNNNQIGEENHSDLIGNLITQQQNPQTYARNVNADNKVIFVENCGEGEVIINDNDQIIQTNTQSFNQEANNQVSDEDDLGLIGNLITQQQNPQTYARNVNADNKVIFVENCGEGEVIINDNDQIIQTNTQSFNQEANNQVDEGEEEDED
jgi:O-acetylhomoserine/O-acetylserine sulfhydrylase-like pyridoxal-dependent enzyme